MYLKLGQLYPDWYLYLGRVPGFYYVIFQNSDPHQIFEQKHFDPFASFFKSDEKRKNTFLNCIKLKFCTFQMNQKILFLIHFKNTLKVIWAYTLVSTRIGAK